MIKRKGKFLTFCFSLLPGAGHMYLGFMKQGISVMLFFFGTLFITSILGLEPLLFFLPIIWFYSFFDVLNKNSMCDEDFYRIEDRYLLSLGNGSLSRLLQGKFSKIIAYTLILIGISLLFSNFRYFLGTIAGRFGVYLHLLDRIPQLILAAFIILVGIRLIQGKKIELLGQEEFLYSDGNPANTAHPAYNKANDFADTVKADETAVAAPEAAPAAPADNMTVSIVESTYTEEIKEENL